MSMRSSPQPGRYSPTRLDPLTGRELAARVIADHGIDGDAEAIRHAINVRLALVQVPPRGLWGKSGQPKYVALDAWTGRKTPGPRATTPGPRATMTQRPPWTTSCFAICARLALPASTTSRSGPG